VIDATSGGWVGGPTAFTVPVTGSYVIFYSATVSIVGNGLGGVNSGRAEFDVTANNTSIPGSFSDVAFGTTLSDTVPTVNEEVTAQRQTISTLTAGTAVSLRAAQLFVNATVSLAGATLTIFRLA
jgi:hypothetical protein